MILGLAMGVMAREVPLCLTAPPVTQNLRGQAPIAFLSRALGTPSLAAVLSTVLRCFSKGWRSRIFVKMSAVFSSVPRYLTVTNPAPRIWQRTKA